MVLKKERNFWLPQFYIDGVFGRPAKRRSFFRGEDRSVLITLKRWVDAAVADLGWVDGNPLLFISFKRFNLESRG